MARAMKDSGIEWIGEIPIHWNYRKCKTILSANDGGVWGNDPKGDGTDKIVIRSTEQTIDGKWCIENPALRDLGSVDYSKSRIEKDDLLITKSSGSDLHIGKTTIAHEYFVEHECYYSNFIQRIRCHDYNPRLLWYLFNSLIVREQCVFLQNSTSGIGNINSEIINNIIIPIPPVDDQQRIVNILDAECARIDAVIEQTRASIEEYKKLKQAVITQAVTKGIRGDRPMKDSGIEWIGEIPADWECKPIKYVAVFQPACDSSRLQEDSIITYTPMDCIKNGFYVQNTAPLGSVAASLTPFENGDIAMAKVTSCFENGNIAIMDHLSSGFGMGSSELFVYRPTAIIARYLLYWLQNDLFKQEACATMTGTGGLKRVSPYFAKNCAITVPPQEEQIQVVEYLDTKCREIRRLVDAKLQFISELEAYKKSLIYEYVTGKKEV